MIQQPLSEAERLLVEAQLNEAVAAYHQLTVGRSASVIVDQNGERVEFTMTNSARLAQYITSLRLKLNACRHAAHRMVGPATFTF